MENFLDNLTLDQTNESQELRRKIFAMIKEYTLLSHQKKPFVPGITSIPVSGKVYDYYDLQMLAASSLDFWLTSGRYNDEFERKLSDFLGVNFVLTTNSGSSANLLALTALTSEELGEQRLNSGDEVITVAAGFPTTVNPIIQNNLIPVFVDVTIPTYVIDSNLIESAITEKTRAIMVAHTLGNSFNIDEVMRLAKKYDLWVVEDCCDALGTTYQGKPVGTFGDIGTVSFYPAHHITMGEGGAVFSNDALLKRIIESFRDWGRDCFCPTGCSNTCGKRFGWKLGDLPFGYDHKYTYSHVGYNLKITDMQAAVGLSQLQKLPEFIQKRRKNFNHLKQRLSAVSDYLVLPEPTTNSDPSWFGFPITVRENLSFSREDLINFLSEFKIDTRSLFAGNIVRQPYFKNIKHRISGDLKNSDLVMNNSFWIGVFPGLTEEMLEFVSDKIITFVEQHK